MHVTSECFYGQSAAPRADRALSRVCAKPEEGASARESVFGGEEGSFTCGDDLLEDGLFGGGELLFVPLMDEGLEAVGEMMVDVAFLRAIEASSHSVEGLVELFELLSAD